MISLCDITSFDVIVALIFLVFIIRGVWIGFMRQLASLLALIGSYWLAGRYSDYLMPYVGRFIDNPKVVFFISFAVLFVVGAFLLILTGKVLQLVMDISLLGWFDRLLGLGLGAFKAFFVAAILHMALSAGLSSSNNLMRKSLSSKFLARGAEIVQEVIRNPELRRLFIPREPAIKPDKKSSAPSPAQEKKPV